MSKKKMIVSYKNLPNQVKGEMYQRYPFGFEQFLTTISTKEGQALKALYLELNDAIYLIKFTPADLRKLSNQFVEEDDDNTMDFEGYDEGDYTSDVSELSRDSEDDEASAW